MKSETRFPSLAYIGVRGVAMKLLQMLASLSHHKTGINMRTPLLKFYGS
ncbi:hypothetical protein SAMN05216248_101723 [Pseudomonas simiae]|nr:hypothetical protein SAMN05216248_101723 [Pseudomonas simiae]